eukprot:SAG22_NODE_6242_length_881_cov_1.586957_1_plen_86_part_00
MRLRPGLIVAHVFVCLRLPRPSLCSALARNRTAKRIRAGTIWINCYDTFDASLPFGGFKASGIGRELGESALSNYLESKTMAIKM